MPERQQERGQLVDELPAGLASPARRALLAAGITRLEHLTRLREADVLLLHGMGPNAMRVLREALNAHGLSFAAPSARP